METSMEQAAGVIASLAAAGGPRAVVAVTGPVGSGKTTLARQLSACVLSTDDYLPDYDRVPEHERDDPAHMDFAGLVSDLLVLRRGGVARVPVWSFQSHRRESWREQTPPGETDVIVVEGIHAHHARLAHAVQVRVFVDAPRDVRWARWEFLEATGQRGWGVAYARRFFEGVAEPAFARHAGHARDAAHVVVRNDAWRPITPPA